MTIGIVGLGLIGGSIGLAARANGTSVIGMDSDPKNGSVALERGCVDELASLEEIAACDFVFVAVPPDSVIPLLEGLLPIKAENTIVTDCTSVKAAVVEWLLAKGDREPKFVAGHPMAGHEKSGPAYASAWMFRKARWILSPTKHTSKSAMRALEGVLKEFGAEPVRIDAATHDRQVALLSHLPHAVAGAMVRMAAETDGTEASGGSWKDITRVGGVDPNLWTQIFLSNGQEIGNVLHDLTERLEGLRHSLANKNESAVRAFFESAANAKEQA